MTGPRRIRPTRPATAPRPPQRTPAPPGSSRPSGRARGGAAAFRLARGLTLAALNDKAMFGPVIEPAFLNGVGPRLEVHGLGLIGNHAYSAPYEDLRLKRP